MPNLRPRGLVGGATYSYALVMGDGVKKTILGNTHFTEKFVMFVPSADNPRWNRTLIVLG